MTFASTTGSSSSRAKKPVLFHSTYCKYCRTVVSFLAQNELTDAFSLFCVDGNRNQIPRFVTSVPTMLLADKRMLTDEAVWEYVKRLADLHRTKKAKTTEVSPLSSASGLGTFENLEGSPFDDIEDDGTYVRFDASPSITGLSSSDPSKPLSEDQILSTGGGVGGRHMRSMDAFKQQRDDAIAGGPSRNAAFMGGSLTGGAEL